MAQGLEAAELTPPAHAGQVVWLEVANRENATLAPAALQRIEQWQAAGFRVASAVTPGLTFWQTTEIETLRALLDATPHGARIMNYTETALRFTCADEYLFGILACPERPSDTGVVIVVGGPQTRVGSHRQFVLLSRALAAAGYPVLRFDVRGMGDSSGEQRDFEPSRPTWRGHRRAADALALP